MQKWIGKAIEGGGKCKVLMQISILDSHLVPREDGNKIKYFFPTHLLTSKYTDASLL